MTDMDTEKDYYAILGVLPSIDDVAIAAVYRALIKKYHPDVFSGSKSDAENRVREIIEAYEVLGNSEHRKIYDSARAENSFGSYRQEEQTDSYSNELAADWGMVKKYYPAAEEMREYLAKLSPSLAFTFQITVLEEKLASNAHDTGSEMAAEFFERYFGTSSKVREFVFDALLRGRRDVAKEVNRAIKVLGTPDDSDTDGFIEQVCKAKDYRTQEMQVAWEAINKLRPGELPLGEISPDEEIWLTKVFSYLSQIAKGNRANNPFCIFEATNDVCGMVYVQFLAPEYARLLICEAVSAENNPGVAPILTLDRQRLLYEFGFAPPSQNYSTEIDIECDDDIAYAARLAFHVLRKIYDVRNFSSGHFILGEQYHNWNLSRKVRRIWHTRRARSKIGFEKS
jgi:DnaJ domain